MPRIAYEDWKPKGAALEIVSHAQSIASEYQQQGYDLTLRQLYYQFVARDLIPNTHRDYKRLGEIVNRARMAGYLDWNYIVDRTRNLMSLPHWETPGEIIASAARSFALDKWDTQARRVEVWVEKEALAGVVSRAAEENDCAWFSCRGYVSQSEMWSAAQRFQRYIQKGQGVVILHLGDHDPSGIDMTRDIEDRLRTFISQDWLNAHPDHFDGPTVYVRELFADMRKGIPEQYDALEIRRIALNADQIEEYDPPPNPAKLTDSRADAYVAAHGDESWELDALPPDVLHSLIVNEIDTIVDVDAYSDIQDRETEETKVLDAASKRWADVAAFLAPEKKENGDARS